MMHATTGAGPFQGGFSVTDMVGNPDANVCHR